MGREVKVVHLDFDWYERTNEDTWYGYLLDQVECELCNGSGKNLKGRECPDCYGEGKISPRIEPPKSWDDEKNGFQIWQNVSEGGPVSPVFKKPEDLAKWMIKNDTSITKGTSYEAWLKMIKEEGSSPSMVGSFSEGVKPGTSLYEEKVDK